MLDVDGMLDELGADQYAEWLAVYHILKEQMTKPSTGNWKQQQMALMQHGNITKTLRRK